MWPKSYAVHNRRAEERLSSFETKIIDSAWGTIEYAERGTGIPLLVSHGIAGGFDAAVETAKVWAGDGFRVIGPSRFGYFRSTLPKGANPGLQADAFGALLDALGIDRAGVLGFSAGGPPAIQFALRHPERTLALVLASAHLPTSPYVKLPAVLYRMVFSERIFWLLKTLAPRRLARIMGVPKGFRATPEEWKSIRYLMDGLFPIRPRRQGFVLDGILTNPDVEHYPLEEIAVPTLIIHSADDTLAHYETAPRAAARIPDARFVTIDRGGHLFVGREAKVRKEVSAFVGSHAAPELADRGVLAERRGILIGSFAPTLLTTTRSGPTGDWC